MKKIDNVQHNIIEHLKENKTKLVWTIAWPILALESLQVTNQLLDNFFVGHLPTSVLTALGASVMVNIFIFAIALCLNAAAVALVSRAYGANNQHEINSASRQLISLCIFIGSILLVLGLFFNPLIANFLIPKGNSEALQNMIRYNTYLFIGMPGCFLMQSIAGSFIGVEDTKSPMIMSGFQILLHILLNFLLIMPTTTVFGLTIPCYGLGLNGAGLAYAISMWASAFVYLFWIQKKIIGRVFASFIPQLDWMKRIFKIAGPASITWLIRLMTYTAITKILGGFSEGSEAIAAVRIGFAIENIAFVPALALGIAASTLVGQSLGMKDSKRAEKLTWISAHYAAIVSAIIALLIFVWAEPIANIMVTGKPNVSAHIATYVRYLCVTEIFFAYAVVLLFAMQGAGDTIRPLIITTLWFSLLRIPLAWYLSHQGGLGVEGCWIAMSISQFTQGIASIIVFRKGKWKTVKV